MAASEHRSLSQRVRVDQVETTRRRILEAAERLFAEDGVFSVSNRQIGAAAGQGNNAVVGYHFGTKAELVRAIVARHAVPMERIRADLIARYAGSTDLRDWVTCLVRPFTDHLAAQEAPTWYARFAAQLLTEPKLRELAAAELTEAPLLQSISESLHHCLPGIPPEIRTDRDSMAWTVIVHLCAQRERALAEEHIPPGEVWNTTAIRLIDAIVGLYLAAVS